MPGGSKLGLLGAAALAGLGLTAVWLRSSNTPTRAEPQRAPASTGSEEKAELTALSRQLSLLRAELGGLKERVYQTPPEARSTPERQEATPPSTPPPTPQPVTVEAAQAHFDRVFDTEVRDASWARDEEASIGDFVRREGGDGSSLETIACRSSMCRMELRFGDDRARDAFKLKLGTPPLNNGGFYREQGETGLVYFAARAGHPLPPVPPE